jgi:hypothetical protein
MNSSKLIKGKEVIILWPLLAFTFDHVLVIYRPPSFTRVLNAKKQDQWAS